MTEKNLRARGEGANEGKFFIDHCSEKWLKVEAGGVKWMNSPLINGFPVFTSGLLRWRISPFY
jgi:hypothetical protein